MSFAFFSMVVSFCHSVSPFSLFPTVMLFIPPVHQNGPHNVRHCLQTGARVAARLVGIALQVSARLRCIKEGREFPTCGMRCEELSALCLLWFNLVTI